MNWEEEFENALLLQLSLYRQVTVAASVVASTIRGLSRHEDVQAWVQRLAEQHSLTVDEDAARNQFVLKKMR